MESYLANIDAYMHEQQEEEQQHQQQPIDQQALFADLNTPSYNDLWLDELPLDLPTQPIFSPSPIFLTEPSQINTVSPSPINYLVPQATQFIPSEPTNTARKKPGRKPTQVPPALRKAQNRAAQRAFRERKERHLKDLESSIRHLREQSHAMQRELDLAKQQVEAYKVETWYLKGLVLTLQFVCMYHHIKLPTHAPYMTEESLSQVAEIAPHVLEAYVDAYTRNNTLITSTVNDRLDKKKKHEAEKETCDDSPMMDTQVVNSPLVESNLIEDSDPTKEDEATLPDQIQNSMDAIQHIRSKLGCSEDDSSSAGLHPTILQLAIPHDPRIDLIPTPHLRDRMIIFRNLIDFDKCFSILFRKSVFHGGDPTNHKNWELPPEFFSEFWYLFLEYDIKKTNRWRRSKGLPELTSGPQPDIWAKRPHPTKEDEKQTIYDLLLKQPPEARKPVDPPTLENIIERMTSL